jgi:hypothetical protein
MAVTFTQTRKSTCNLGHLVSFSGGFSPLDTSGLMPFEGTVTVIANNRDGFCWGQKVTITVEGMGTGWLPELYVKSVSPLDIKTGEISVNVGCVISLLSNKTFDDFKDEKDFLTDAIPGADQQIRYWWQQWELLNRDGTAIEENPEESPIIKDVTITSIVQEMCRHLNLPCSGGVAGKKRLPYTPSGNLLSEIGTLIFNSESPSYAYSDHRGHIRITTIDFTPNNGFSIALGQSELDKDYNPVDGGVEPIKRLVVTYTLQELEAECDKTLERCYTSSQLTPGMDITGNPDDTVEVVSEETKTCEWVACGVSGTVVSYFGIGEANVKAIEVSKKALPGYLFPGSESTVTSLNDSYYELRNEYYDAEEGLLIAEAMWKQEPIGIVYGGWIGSHEHWHIPDQLEGGTGNSVDDFQYKLAIGRGPISPAVLPSGRAGENKYDMTLTDSEYSETKYYYNDSQVLAGKVTTTWMPISKAMPDFNGNSFNGTGEAIVDFEVPPTNTNQYVQFDFEILEKDQWVDLVQILTPDPQKPTEKRAVFQVYSGFGGGAGAFSGATVITSIVSETWDYSCSGGTKHMVEEKVLKYEYASEIEGIRQEKYAQPLNVILNVKVYDANTNYLKKQSKSTLTTETPNKFITVRMWGTRQEGFDEYLRRNNLDEYDDTFYTPYPDDWSLLAGGEGYTMQYDNYDIIPTFITRSDLLKLVTKRTITNSSTGGGESPASSEFLSCALTDTVKWRDVPGVLEIDGFLCHTGKYDPPTEVMDLGLVYDISYVRKLGNTIMNMRQAQSIQYELICKLDPQVCGFPPVRTIRVKESCQTNADLVFIGNSQGITIGSDEMVVSWDLWQIGYNPGTTTANWSYPPDEYIVGDIGDTGIIIAPPPQYVITPSDYNGNGVITIGSDTVQGTITQVPNYVSTPTIPDNTWVTIIGGDETINTWVSDGQIEVPTGFVGDVLVISGNDTLTQTVIETPDRIELPSGYYPSDNIFIDDTIPASLESDDTVPVYITNPIIIDGDDTLISAWPAIVGVGGIARLKVQSHAEYLSYGLGMRTVMIRGDGQV